MNTHTHTHINKHIYVRQCIYWREQTVVILALCHTQTHVHTHTQTHTHTHTYIYTWIHTCMHTYTHTHTCAPMYLLTGTTCVILALRQRDHSDSLSFCLFVLRKFTYCTVKWPRHNYESSCQCHLFSHLTEPISNCALSEHFIPRVASRCSENRIRLCRSFQSSQKNKVNG
jgi:hypothetical protein